MTLGSSSVHHRSNGLLRLRTYSFIIVHLSKGLRRALLSSTMKKFSNPDKKQHQQQRSGGRAGEPSLNIDDLLMRRLFRSQFSFIRTSEINASENDDGEKSVSKMPNIASLSFCFAPILRLRRSCDKNVFFSFSPFLITHTYA